MKLFTDDGRDCRNRRWLIFFCVWWSQTPQEASSRSEEVGLAARDECTCFRGNSHEGASDWRCKADWRIWIPGCIPSVLGSLYTYCKRFLFSSYCGGTCYCNCNLEDKMENVITIFAPGMIKYLLRFLFSFICFWIRQLPKKWNALQCVIALHEIRVCLTFLSTVIQIYLYILSVLCNKNALAAS